MTEMFSLDRFYIIMLLIIVALFGWLYSDTQKELNLIKKECINRGYAYFDCDNSGRAIFKFKTQEEQTND